MKNKEKKIKATEEAKKEVQTEEEGVELTDEQLSKVSAGSYYTDFGKDDPFNTDFGKDDPFNYSYDGSK